MSMAAVMARRGDRAACAGKAHRAQKSRASLSLLKSGRCERIGAGLQAFLQDRVNAVPLRPRYDNFVLARKGLPFVCLQCRCLLPTRSARRAGCSRVRGACASASPRQGLDAMISG